MRSCCVGAIISHLKSHLLDRNQLEEKSTLILRL